MRFRTVGLAVLLIVVCLIAVLATRDPMWVRKPFVRTDASEAAIAAFKAAVVVPSQIEKQYNNRVWNEALSFGTPTSTVTIIGVAHMDVISADYRDGSRPYRVFEPADYTNTIEVRVKDQTLYVYRGITLLWVEYRLAVFDLATRKQLDDRLVAPEDMPTQPPTNP